MTKVSSFKDQIVRAQQTVSGWSPAQRSSLQLEGREVFYTSPVTNGSLSSGESIKVVSSKQAEAVG